MVKEDILHGLKMAIEKGEPLKKAMMSFYNAGYLKKDIEEAARALQAPQFQLAQTTPTQQVQQPIPIQQQQVQPTPQQPVQPVSSQPVSPQQIQPILPTSQIQTVSNYAEKPKPLGMIITFILIFFLLVLLGVLLAVFLFKNELAGLFNSVL